MSIELNYIIKEKKELSGNNLVYELSIPYKDFESWALEFRKNKKIPGFRDGMANIINFQQDWEKSYIKQVTDDILKKEDLKDIVNYAYIYENFNHTNVEIFCELILEKKIDLPELNLENVTIKNPIITDEDAESNLVSWEKSNFKKNQTVEREIQKDDFVKIQANDGKVFDVRIGQKDLIKEIEEKLIGKMKDETIEHTFYNNGIEQEVVFTIIEVQDSVCFDESDSLKKFNATNREELISKFKESLKIETEIYTKDLIKQDIKKAILKLKFEPFIPKVRKEFQVLFDNELLNMGYDQDLDNAKLVEEFLAKNDIEYKTFNQNIYTIAYNLMKLDMYLFHLSEKLNFKIEQNEVEAKVKEKSNLFKKGFKEAESYFAKEENQSKLMFEILDQKVMDYLLNNNKFVTEDIKLKDLYNQKGE